MYIFSRKQRGWKHTHTIHTTWRVAITETSNLTSIQTLVLRGSGKDDEENHVGRSSFFPFFCVGKSNCQDKFVISIGLTVFE